MSEFKAHLFPVFRKPVVGSVNAVGFKAHLHSGYLRYFQPTARGAFVETNEGTVVGLSVGWNVWAYLAAIGLLVIAALVAAARTGQHGGVQVVGAAREGLEVVLIGGGILAWHRWGTRKEGEVLKEGLSSLLEAEQS